MATSSPALSSVSARTGTNPLGADHDAHPKAARVVANTLDGRSVGWGSGGDGEPSYSLRLVA
jgi:hypothetical protein